MIALLALAHEDHGAAPRGPKRQTAVLPIAKPPVGRIQGALRRSDGSHRDPSAGALPGIDE